MKNNLCYINKSDVTSNDTFEATKKSDN